MIIIDVHETEEVKRYLRQRADEVDEWSEFGGDYIVSDWLVERKRWREVAGRMLETDRHLYWQLEKLKTSAEAMELKPVLLVEGDLGATLEHTKLPRERMSRYLAGVTRMRIHTVLSTSRENTAKILCDLETDEYPDVQRTRGSPPSRQEEPRFIVEGISGLGPSKAKTLLQEFKSARGVANASVDEIQSIHGFGEKSARQVYNAFRNEY